MPPAASAPPSIYKNMADMSMGAKPGGDAAAKGGEAGAGGGMEEKKQILTTLLEVFKKWDKLETDPTGKQIIADMMGKAEEYKKTVLKETGDAAATPPPGGNAPPAPPPPDAGGAGGAGGKKGLDVPA